MHEERLGRSHRTADGGSAQRRGRSLMQSMMVCITTRLSKRISKLTQLVHDNDSKIVMQLAYGGTKTTHDLGERVIFAPSEF
ncbi:hypothetical protein O9992_30360 [Vibrio lentus]|nr:hypothetical protein [Vibrio lentus]